MATIEYEGGTGGKFRKRPLRRVPSTPYDRPPLAASGIHGLPPETEAGGSRWFSKLVDPASQVIVRNASRLLSVFGKGLAAPPGEQINIIEEVPQVKLSPELKEHGENPADARLSRQYVGTDRSEQELISRNDSIFELEQLLKQKRFSRAEIDHLAELLHSRTIEPSILPSTDYKNKGKINEDSSINSSSSQEAVNHEEMEKGKANPSKLECQIEQLVNLNENVTSGVHVNIFEEGFDSPIEIARTYMGLKPKAALSSLGLQNQTCHRDKVSPLNFRFGNKPSNAAIASSSAVCFPVIPRDAGNDCMTQKRQSRSALYKLSRSPYGRSFMWTTPRGYSPYKDKNVELTRSLERTPSLSNIRHSGHGQALKCGSSKRDAGFFGDAQRTCEKSCLKDLNLSTPVNTSSAFILDQEYKHDIDIKGLDNLDCKIPSSILHVPPHSVEMARKILHQLDKLNSSPQNKSSEKKVIVGDASLSKSSFSASHERSLKIKANNSSTKLLNVRGSRILEEPSSSNLARITSSASPSKDKAEGEASLIPYISVGQVASGIGMNSSGTSASVANYSMKSMESNGHGFFSLSMQKEPTVQSAPDDNVESTKAEQAILFSVKDPMEKSFERSFEYAPTSGLMHTDSDTKAFNKTYTERNVSFNFLAARIFNTLSKRLLSSTMAITLADGATSKEDSVSPLKFGSKVSTYNATKPISTGISARLNAGSLSVVSSSTGNGAPKFQFGSGNSSSYSFTGLSAVSSSIGIGVCTPAFSYLYQYSEGSGSLSTSAVFPTSANGVFGVSTSPTSVGSSLQFSSCSSPNTTINFGAADESFCGTEGISTGNVVTNSPVASGLGSSLQASYSSQIGFALSGVKPFTSGFSFSSGGTSSCRNSSLLPAVPVSFSTSSSPFLSSSSMSTTLGFTPLSSPSTGFGFGPTATSGSMPFLLSSRSILPPASTGTTTSTAFLSPTQTVFGPVTSTMGFGPVSHSNDQMIVQDTSTGSNLQAAPTAPTLGQPTNLQPVLSRAPVFQFGTYQNSSPFQTSANLGFSSGGSFSFNSVDGKSSE